MYKPRFRRKNASPNGDVLNGIVYEAQVKENKSLPLPAKVQGKVFVILVTNQINSFIIYEIRWVGYGRVPYTKIFLQ